MATLDSILNFAIPAILILIAVGFVYTKFIQPWVVPHLIKLWEKIRESGNNPQTENTRREIVYE